MSGLDSLFAEEDSAEATSQELDVKAVQVSAEHLLADAARFPGRYFSFASA